MTPATPNRLDGRSRPTERTGPVGRGVRLLLAVGFTYAFATLVDQGGPASIRDPETLTDVPTVVLTIAMVAVYAVLVGELAKIVAGEPVAKTARCVALGMGFATLGPRLDARRGDAARDERRLAHCRRAEDAGMRDRRLGGHHRACAEGRRHRRSALSASTTRRVGSPPPRTTNRRRRPPSSGATLTTIG